MTRPSWSRSANEASAPRETRRGKRRLLPDGGEESDAGETDAEESDAGESDAGADGEEGDDGEHGDPTDEGEDPEGPDVETSSVEVTEAGEAEPVDPKWEEPDLDDIPEVDGPKTRPAESSDAGGDAGPDGSASADSPRAGHEGQPVEGDDSTAGMPNTARSPGQSRLREGGTDGYVVAIELCAQLPEAVRLPEEAADQVPVALEAELEQDVQSFAADAFDNPNPHVETLDFVEADGDLWLRLRLGISPESFDDVDPDEIRDHALQKLDALL